MFTLDTSRSRSTLFVARHTGSRHSDQADTWTEPALILQNRIHHDYVHQRGGLDRQAASDLIRQIDGHPGDSAFLEVGATGGFRYVIDQQPRQSVVLLLRALNELDGLGATAEQLAAELAADGLFRTPAGYRSTPVTRYLEWWSGREWQLLPGLRLRLVGCAVDAALPAVAAEFSRRHAVGGFPDLTPPTARSNGRQRADIGIRPKIPSRLG